MKNNLHAKTLVLIILCILSFILNILLTTLGLLLYFTVYLLSLVLFVGFLVATIGIFKLQKYGFIIAVITSAFALGLSVISLALIEMVLYGCTLVLAILEIINYERNYQLGAKDPQYSQTVNPRESKMPYQVQDHSLQLSSGSIQGKDPKFCPYCGVSGVGQYCRECGKRID
ncbi:MAG: hypothetical protein GF383_13880 [Candidatus Lokiarchaeota archaeon]|nr:hypothetical protein [Candidatus Lokiarchaeota archaeon]MBD3342395.1 hypothetical protein [Candidatus Lokiarchaeota archaeon]